MEDKNEKRTPPNSAGQAYFSLLRRWAEELEADWNEVLELAGITDTGRSTRNRIIHGTASLSTAHDIGQALLKLEEKTGKRAVVGPQAMLLREWTELGALLALYDPDIFDDILGRMRRIVDGAEARATGPFTRAAK